MFFLLFLLDDGRIQIWTFNFRIQIREAQKVTNPMDPEHLHKKVRNPTQIMTNATGD
jgi:hypothetical protein